MRILRHPAALEPADRGSAVAIGNFDGVHRGHQAVIARAGEIAAAERRGHAVLTFEPHPYQVFRPEAPPSRLTPFRVKARRIEALGVELLFMLHFDLALAAVSAEAFVDRVLREGLDAGHVVIGYDFHFGNRRRGTPELLSRLGAKLGFGVTIMAPVEAAGGAIYSSTRIREHLSAGRPREAAALLGQAWEIEGRVEPGDRRGRTIGFPTANLSLADYLRPAAGVYAVRAGIERAGGEVEWHDGVANFGQRPTFAGSDLRLEVHIFGCDEELYGRHLRVRLIDYLRPERKFPSLEALKSQIADDAAQARQLLASGAPAPIRPPLG